MHSQHRPLLPAATPAARFDPEDLSPANFGMVMATGIVSIASHLLGLPTIAQALFALNVVLFGALWVLTVVRVLRHPRRVLADVTDHLRAPGFFTTVAAASIVGSQFALLRNDHRTATALWILAVVLWVGLTYTIFTALTIKQRKPRLDRGINGSWLLAVVATQSVAVLGAVLAQHAVPPFRLALNFLALSMWLWGGMLYIWMIAIIFFRYMFFRLEPSELSPPYWINMGAMAISTLAGSLLIVNEPDALFLQSLLPFLKGFTVFYWATGTWWIPMLLVLALWRYVWRRFPVRYDPLYWGAVFPLGMYAAATQQLTTALDLPFLAFLPPIFMAAALAAWSATFFGLVRAVIRRVCGPGGPGDRAPASGRDDGLTRAPMPDDHRPANRQTAL